MIPHIRIIGSVRYLEIIFTVIMLTTCSLHLHAQQAYYNKEADGEELLIQDYAFDDPRFLEKMKELEKLVGDEAPIPKIITAGKAAISSIPKISKKKASIVYFIYLVIIQEINKRNDHIDLGVDLVNRALSNPPDIDGGQPYRDKHLKTFGILLAKANNPEKAIKILKGLSVKLTYDSEIWLYLALAYEKNKQIDLAIDACLRSLAIYSDNGIAEKAESRLRALYLKNNGYTESTEDRIKQVKESAIKNEALIARKLIKVAPEWELPSLDSKIIKLSDLKGKIVIMNFWGSWCPPCKKELRKFQAMHDKYRNREDIIFLGINSEQPGPEKAKRDTAVSFIAANKYTFPIVLDLDDSTYAIYGPEGLPATYLIDRNGIIRFYNNGASDKLQEMIEYQLSYLMNGDSDGVPIYSGDDLLEEASRLVNWAGKMHEARMYKGIPKVALRALGLVQAEQSKSSIDLLLNIYNILGLSYSHLKQLDKAAKYYSMGVEFAGTNKPEDRLILLYFLMQAGRAHANSWNYINAENNFHKALQLAEKEQDEKPAILLSVLSDLGNVYVSMRNFGNAEDVFTRANKIAVNSKDVSVIDISNTLFNLANLSHSWGDDGKALEQLKAAGDMLSKAKDANPLKLAEEFVRIKGLEMHISLESPLATQKEYSDGEQFYKKMLESTEGFPESEDRASVLMNMGLLYSNMDNYEKARDYIGQAMSIYDKVYDRESIQYAQPLTNSAYIDYWNGSYSNAIAKYSLAASIYIKHLDPNHFYVYNSNHNLSLAYEAAGDIDKALKHRATAESILDYIVSNNMIAGSEHQKLSYLKEQSYDTNYLMNLHVFTAKDRLDSRRLALTSVLRRKGLVIDVMSQTIATLRNNLHSSQSGVSTLIENELLNDLLSKRARYAGLLSSISGSSALSIVKEEYDGDSEAVSNKDVVLKLREEIDALEIKLSKLMIDFPRSSTIKPVMIDDIQSRLPSGSYLVEYVLFHEFDKKTRNFTTARYGAFVLGASGEPEWVQLSKPASDIDGLIVQYRRMISDPSNYSETQVRQAASNLENIVFKPIRALFKPNSRQIFISPDSQLNLIPFSALVDDSGQYLVNKFDFYYLTSGRMLLSPKTSMRPQQRPVIFANPVFGESSKAYSALTGEENDIKQILPNAELYWGANATKENLLKVNSPIILHIITHGNFIEDKRFDSNTVHNSILSVDGPLKKMKYTGREAEHSMIRAGIALAGANNPLQSSNGIMSALEMSALKLQGTKLAVLAACDTGVGNIQNGEGVYGLRRALAIAGSENQIISLWKVDPIVTSAIFKEFYTDLKSGKATSEALNEVQRRMLQVPERRHPYYWAAFIHSGLGALINNGKQ